MPTNTNDPVSYTYQPNGNGGWNITAAWVNYCRPTYETNQRALDFANSNRKNPDSRRGCVWEYFTR